jgi:hypothetical protein
MDRNASPTPASSSRAGTTTETEGYWSIGPEDLAASRSTGIHPAPRNQPKAAVSHATELSATSRVPMLLMVFTPPGMGLTDDGLRALDAAG